VVKAIQRAMFQKRKETETWKHANDAVFPDSWKLRNNDRSQDPVARHRIPLDATSPGCLRSPT